MKWLFLVLLLVNLGYLGWEIDRQTRYDVINRKDALPVPVNVKRLVLLNELPSPPGSTTGAAELSADREVSGITAENGTVSTRPSREGGFDADRPNDVQIEEEIVSLLVSRLPDISTRRITDGMSGKQLSCFSFGPFPDDQQTRDLIAWFEDREVTVQQRQEKDDGKQLFWVYLDPKESRGQAMMAIEDLKDKGITDFRLIETGDLQNAVSLGLFSTQAAVNRRLNELKDRGYQAVVVPYRNTKSIYWVDISLEDQAEVMSEMYTGLPARYNFLPVRCSKIAFR